MTCCGTIENGQNSLGKYLRNQLESILVLKLGHGRSMVYRMAASEMSGFV